MNLYVLIKRLISSHPFFSILATVALCVPWIATAIPILHSFLPIPIVVFVFIGIFVTIVRIVCKEIETSTVDTFGVKKPAFEPIVVSSAKKLKQYVLILFLLPIGLLVSSGYTYYIEKTFCDQNRNKIGLFLANFSSKPDEDDGFTSTLYGKLNSNLQNVDSIYLKQLGNYISESKDNYIDTVKGTFGTHCVNSGLFVFGNRNDDKIFNCRIFSFNYLPKIEKSFITRDNTIIYIQNPQILNFSIENEATIVANFLYGLLYFKKGEEDNSSKYFNEALSLNENKENKQFITLCRLFLGDNKLRKHDYNGAIEEFKAGIAIDSTNAFLRYNLASAFRILGDFPRAYREYQVAQKINSSFKNPLVIDIDNSDKKHDSYLSGNFPNPREAAEMKKNHQSGLTQPEFLSEKFMVLEIGDKSGVVSSSHDTIVPISYDGILTYPYHGSNCFVLRSGKRYGVAIEKKFDDGYTVHRLPMDYSASTIIKAAEFCVDNHMFKKDTSLEFFRFKIRRQ